MKNTIKLYITLSFVLWNISTHSQILNEVSGIVINADTSNPVSGVNLTATDSSVKIVSNSDGKFTISGVTNFPWYFNVSKDGFTEELLEVYSTEELVTVYLHPDQTSLNELVITSRRRNEILQDIPIPISLIGGAQIEQLGSFNVNKVKELVPTVQLYSSNPRNTTLNIRGLGSTYGLTNDGVDPGVGMYIDGVYHARPAATALDFIDIERIEVLRGPQGTLFGKNTTAGAFNIISRLPHFSPGATAELSYGNYGFIQAKTSITGPLIKDKLAGRLSFSGTQRNGTLYNVHTDRDINDINNSGVKGQLLFTPNYYLKISLTGDLTVQRPDGYGWGIAGVVKNQRSEYRQFENIIKDLGYEIPYKSAFERKVDLDTPSKADNDLGGVALNVDYQIGNGTLTSTSAWRFWHWAPLNDRDYLGVPVYTVSAGNSSHDQWSQEIRYAGEINEKVSGVIGIYGLWQDLKTDPVHTEEAGDALWRFQQSNDSQIQWAPGLIDRVGIRTKYGIKSSSLAVFSQIDWAITEKLHVLPGIRYNYDKKVATYDRKKYINNNISYTLEQFDAINSIYSDQQFDVNADAGNLSGQLSLQYRFTPNYNVYGTYSKSYKPIGINVGGLPVIDGKVATDLAAVKPETVNHVEVGVKTSPARNFFLNATLYSTVIDDYQTQVQTPDPGVNRGYLANAEKVSVKGFELDGSIKPWSFFKLNAALAYTDGKYDKFTNAPVPLEEVGGAEAFKDISGGELPGISKWSWTLGTELSSKGSFLSLPGDYFLSADVFYRSKFSSSASPSQYLNIDAYALLNARIGFRGSNGWTVTLWSRNLANKNYYEQLLAAPGNYGHYAGVVGDPATYGITFKYTLN